MNQFESSKNPDSGIEITQEIEGKLSALPVDATGLGNGLYVAITSVDAASGRFIRFGSREKEQPGEAKIRIVWKTAPLPPIDLAKDFMGNLKSIKIAEVYGAPMSELALQRVGDAIINIRERIREN